jgi:uncharacterized protein YcfJ
MAGHLPWGITRIRLEFRVEKGELSRVSPPQTEPSTAICHHTGALAITTRPLMDTIPAASHDEPATDSPATHISIGKKTVIGGSGALLGAIVGGPIGAVVGGAIGTAVGSVAEHNPSGKTSHAIDETVKSVRKAAGSTESVAKTVAARTVAVAKGAAEGAKREMKATK